MCIKEFAMLCGVSVRTLHYYDEIGLLRPRRVDEETGYRFYDNSSLLRMQEILFYRELDFPLKTIAALLASPQYDRQTALCEQKRMLTLKKERLERLIEAIDHAEKGENVMKAFDKSKLEQYKEEAKARWGDSAAYAEYERKTRDDPTAESALESAMNEVFAAFAACKARGCAPASNEARALVSRLQAVISEHAYICTDVILKSLGQMYVGDERFRATIDRNAPGTAEFVSRAIEAF